MNNTSNWFTPEDWYWGPSPAGQYYASGRQVLVARDEVGFVAWRDVRGHDAVAWPRDAHGDQTDAALLDVVSAYGFTLPGAVGLTAYAANARWLLETGGITVNGMRVATDRSSQAQIVGAWATVQVNPSATIQWKTADGTWVALDAAHVGALAQAVSNHVQGCFAAEAAVDARINANPATITTVAQVDAALAALVTS